MITLPRRTVGPTWLPAFALAFVLAIAFALGFAATQPAWAGMIRIEPGATAQIDVGDRSNYTAITITNDGTAAGQLELGAPVNRVVDVPAGGNVELYGIYGRGVGSYVSVRNSGSAPLRLLSRYQETIIRP